MKIKILILTFLGALTVLAADPMVVTPSQGNDPAQNQNYNNPTRPMMPGVTNNMPYRPAPEMTNQPDFMDGSTNLPGRPGNWSERTNNWSRGSTNWSRGSTNWNRGDTNQNRRSIP